jgi:molecular chaperone GrpE
MSDRDPKAESRGEKRKSPQKAAADKKVSPKKVQEKTKELKAMIEKLTKERDEYKDKYLRNLAEIDNFRKRVKKEKEEYQKYFLSDFLLNLLEVVDNLERALKVRNAANNEQSLLSGVEMIYKQFMDLLKKYDVEEVDALNQPFDPNFHEALSKEEKKDIEEAIILEVYQKGFLYNGKLLRPTLAKVAIPLESDEEDEEKEN